MTHGIFGDKSTCNATGNAMHESLQTFESEEDADVAVATSSGGVYAAELCCCSLQHERGFCPECNDLFDPDNYR